MPKVAKLSKTSAKSSHKKSNQLVKTPTKKKSQVEKRFTKVMLHGGGALLGESPLWHPDE